MWLVCIGVRCALAYGASVASASQLAWLGYAAAAIACAFLLIYLTGARTSGPETFGKPIWWNHMRPVHAFCYAMFAWHVMSQQANAWHWLAIDVLLGTGAFLHHKWVIL